MNVLVLNSGSSSLKYQVLDPDEKQASLSGIVERLGEGTTHRQAVDAILADLGGRSIDAVGHRVVHGGDAFHEPVVIDEAVVRAIEECVPLAPLHNPHNLAGILAAMQALPGVPHVAVFDTAFHARLPRRARTYAIPVELADEHRVRRYGFHGTSHAYVAAEAARFVGRPLGELRIVTLHLGNGASACAVEHGHATETSMGMTPLEGLVMGTRSGDIDVGAVFHLMRVAGLDAAGAERMLNGESGLRGLSGVGNDLRDIEARAADGDDRCRLAIAVYAHRVKKYIGAYAAAMGGLDVVVVTGGIGENSAMMRRRILQRLDFLGIAFDEEANHDADPSAESPVVRVSAPYSRVAALAIKTNEELSIAQQTAALARREDQVAAAPIPIAVSARHVHLDGPTFEKLFGPGRTPTRYRDISQPGQFACEERLALVGPRSRIDGVRVLGPLRSKNQVEISRTDEFKLGVDAPIRDSGKVEGSAPVTLEGPHGSVALEEGLICARRHIHMTPADAERFGVSDRDEVEVQIDGGPRDLTFGDVLVRVSPKYVLEMHIDTDEANAAELDSGATGALVYTPVAGAIAILRSRRSRPVP